MQTLDKLQTLARLEAIIASRAVSSDGDTSYTAGLLAAGPEKCARKFGEEAIELILASQGRDANHTTAEAADVVLLVDKLDRLLPGLEVARNARGIALQSVGVGIGLSFLGMVAAAAGYLAPVQGAVLQEVIDVAVILNALRVLNTVPGTSE